jgi:hypothetical protein
MPAEEAELPAEMVQHVERHVDEEESKTIPKADEVFAGNQALEMKEPYEEKKQQEMQSLA